MQGDILKALIDKLEREGTLSRDEFLVVYEGRNEIDRQWLSRKAFALRCSAYGNDVYLRALIECSSYCRSGCFYCGINRTNCHAERYRLSPDEVIEAASVAYDSGFRTFVLQGGEDPVFVKDLGKMVAELRRKYPDAAITLSFGEWPEEMYAEWKAAGADRYLLRHESAAPEHFARLHPESQRLENRMAYLDPVYTLDIVMCLILMVASLEATRRTLGMVFLIFIFICIAYLCLGKFLPRGTGLRHSGTTLKKFVEMMTMSTSGIFGTPLNTSESYLFYFMVFGALFATCGGGQLLIEIGLKFGKGTGGPAKAAVVSSGLMGMISGAAVANVTTTGCMTIPMMKKTGYTPEQAVQSMADRVAELFQ